MSQMIRSHGLSAPSETAAVESMARVLGEDEARAVWRRARRQSGIEDGAPLGLLELLDVAEALSRFDGFKGVMGTALRIRIQTYQMLASENGIRNGNES
jgi:hypothetical protein